MKERLYNFVRDNRDRIEVFVLLLVIFGLSVLVAPHAHAADQNLSTVTVIDITNETVIQPTPIPTNVLTGRRIEQGSCVMPGETIDIAGLGWYTGSIEYFGPYYDGYAGWNESWVASYTVRSQNLTDFYVEPNFFSLHKGWWFMGGSELDANGYDRLFYVNDTCPREFYNVSGKIIYQNLPETLAQNETELQAAIVANLTRMPVWSENDSALILSRNVTTTMGSPAGTHSWMFGTESPTSLYDQTVPDYNITTFDAIVMANLKEGHYNIVFVKPGKNGILEETYDPVENAIVSPFRGVENTSLKGIDPLTAETFLLARIASSRDDSYEQWKIDLQDPKIMVTKMDQAPLSNNHSVIILAGYTNMNVGDVLNVELDVNRTNRYVTHYWNATVLNNGGEGAYRIWNTSFIVDFNQVAPGNHFFTVSSNEGASATVQVYRRVELLPHYMPPEYLGFFDNSPFLPRPTPEIVQVPGPVHTVIQTVTITPSEQQIKDATWVVLTPVLTEAVIALVVVVLGIILLLWAISAYRRSKS